MRMAGVSGMGFLTVMRPLRSISITMPRPPNLPWVVVRMSLKLSTSSSTECGIERVEHAVGGRHFDFDQVARAILGCHRPQARFDEGKNILDRAAQGPRRIHALDGEYFLFAVDPDRHLLGIAFGKTVAPGPRERRVAGSRGRPPACAWDRGACGRSTGCSRSTSVLLKICACASS